MEMESSKSTSLLGSSRVVGSPAAGMRKKSQSRKMGRPTLKRKLHLAGGARTTSTYRATLSSSTSPLSLSHEELAEMRRLSDLLPPTMLASYSAHCSHRDSSSTTSPLLDTSSSSNSSGGSGRVAATSGHITSSDMASSGGRLAARHSRRLGAAMDPLEVIHCAVHYINQLNATVVARVQNGTLPREALGHLIPNGVLSSGRPNSSAAPGNNRGHGVRRGRLGNKQRGKKQLL